MPTEIKWEDLKDYKGKFVIMEYRGHMEEILVEYFENNVLGITAGENKRYLTINPEWKDKPEIKIYINDEDVTIIGDSSTTTTSYGFNFNGFKCIRPTPPSLQPS